MEYFPHDTLYDCLKARSSPMSEEEARQATRQLLEGLDFMHKDNYAHRDLRPSVSISVKEKGETRVMLRVHAEHFHRLSISRFVA